MCVVIYIRGRNARRRPHGVRAECQPLVQRSHLLGECGEEARIDRSAVERMKGRNVERARAQIERAGADDMTLAKRRVSFRPITTFQRTSRECPLTEKAVIRA